ncbi:hypothetical protein BDZ97DRAFT_1915105 [Flammula alnicola]|nr:hypothetical protein BDZ97DRAFT_1915105 [Flammula alnicola]
MTKKASKSVHKRLRDIDPAHFHHTFGRLPNMRSNSRRNDAPENSLDSRDTPSPGPQRVQSETDIYPHTPTPSGIQFGDQEATRHLSEHNLTIAGHPSLQTPPNIVGQTILHVSSTLNGSSQAATPSTPFTRGSGYFHHARDTPILVGYNDQLGRTTDAHERPLHPSQDPLLFSLGNIACPDAFFGEAEENSHRNLSTYERSSAEEASLFYSSLAPSHPHPEQQPSSSAHNPSSGHESFFRYPIDHALHLEMMAYLSSNPCPDDFSREAAENCQRNLSTHGRSSAEEANRFFYSSLASSHPHPDQQPSSSAHSSSSSHEPSFQYPTDVHALHLEMMAYLSSNQAAGYTSNSDLVASDGGAGNRLGPSFHPHNILPTDKLETEFNPNGPNGGFSGNPE